MSAVRTPAAMVLAPTLLLVACGNMMPMSPSPVSPVRPLSPASQQSGPAGLRIARTRLLAFGDSLTAGVTAPPLTHALNAGIPQSYPFKLEALLRAGYPDQFFSVVNAGKPGEPAEDAVLRLPGLLQAEAPEMVILLHGLNDITFFGQAGVSRTLGHLETLTRQALSGGAEVMLCTLLPQRPSGFRAADPLAVASFNDGIRALALREGVFLIDLSRDFGDLGLIGIDGVHPTEAGYDRMAEMLLHALRSRFEWSSMGETVQ